MQDPMEKNDGARILGPEIESRLERLRNTVKRLHDEHYDRLSEAERQVVREELRRMGDEIVQEWEAE